MILCGWWWCREYMSEPISARIIHNFGKWKCSNVYAVGEIQICSFLLSFSVRGVCWSKIKGGCYVRKDIKKRFFWSWRHYSERLSGTIHKARVIFWADPVLFRSLTSGELKLAQTLFKNIINYDRVKIYCDHNHSRYQSKVITNTRNGEILLSINEYKSDFSADYTNYHDSVKYPHLFIFAISFVWQYYRHDSSFHDNTYASTRWDSYHLDEPHFIFYSMEQQAAMIADCWLLITGCWRNMILWSMKN